jgi:hypothetical protein
MYQIVENTLESGGKYRIKAIVSESESIILWFTVNPTQADVDAVIDNHLRQRAASSPAIELSEPLKCTPWQLRKALNQLGLRDAVEYAVANCNDQGIKDGWEFAIEFNRYDPFIVQFGTTLGKTADEMDALFALAKSL